MGTDFINKLTGIVEENLSNESFGVSELADAVGMSRSNLLRKVRSQTELSVSQFIRKIRLEHAMEMLKQDDFTVSEVSYKVGFGSTSYFIKCFHEEYGVSPGDARENIEHGTLNSEHGTLDIEHPQSEMSPPSRGETKRRGVGLLWPALVFMLLAVILILIFKPFSRTDKAVHKKSIAVLPFINDSGDSTNVYIINGLMESVLNKLQQIDGLKVISRTSVEKYREMKKSIPEIAEDLDVTYIVEGSGQKIGDQIMLNIQLIGSADEHLWAGQYEREAKGIFELQKEVAADIAREIRVIVTPVVEARINKAPTDDLEAYDYFLHGQELYFAGGEENYLEAISYFEKAIDCDPEFAYAHADIALSYFMLDIGKKEKQYAEEINYYSDNALLFDLQLPQSLIAKAVYYMYIGEYGLALPYLEKAVEYNPNSAIALNALSDYYARIAPNSGKYLEYALRGLQLDIPSHDSVLASYTYLHLSNAFIQTGFVDEAEKYIERSLDYDPGNIFSQYVKAFILYAKHGDLHQTKDQLLEVLEKDPTRMDVLQEVAKLYYYLRDYEKSFEYYRQFLAIKKDYGLEIYTGEDAKIAIVYQQMGYAAEADSLFAAYLTFLEYDQSVYKNLGLAVYYANHNEPQKAIEHLALFSEEENIQYWIILFLGIDPLVDPIKDDPDFQRLLKVIEDKFRKAHEQIKESLVDEGLV
jgi:TolB-like protein/AraC-like DNA-binding protein/Tfp pilus assembly protein PilF